MSTYRENAVKESQHTLNGARCILPLPYPFVERTLFRCICSPHPVVSDLSGNVQSGAAGTYSASSADGASHHRVLAAQTCRWSSAAVTQWGEQSLIEHRS